MRVAVIAPDLKVEWSNGTAWPYPTDSEYRLAVVLQEWVTESKGALRDVLEKDPALQRMIEGWERHDPSGRELAENPYFDEMMAAELLSIGVTPTPEVVEWLMLRVSPVYRRMVDGDDVPLSTGLTRGLAVTSFCLAPPSWGPNPKTGPECSIPPRTYHKIEGYGGPGLHVKPARLWERAVKAANNHRHWWEDAEGVTDSRDLRSFNGDHNRDSSRRLGPELEDDLQELLPEILSYVEQNGMRKLRNCPAFRRLEKRAAALQLADAPLPVSDRSQASRPILHRSTRNLREVIRRRYERSKKT